MDKLLLWTWEERILAVLNDLGSCKVWRNIYYLLNTMAGFRTNLE